MMAGVRLVVGDARHVMQRPVGEVVGVDVVGAGPGAVLGGRVVERERLVGLAELLHATDRAVRLRQRAEERRRGLPAPPDLVLRHDDELVGRRRGVGPAGVVGGDRLERARVAEVGRDLPSLGLDRLEPLVAEPMDVGGVEGQRRPSQDLGRVHAVAAGQRGHADRLGRRREVLVAHQVAEPRVCGRDDVADHRHEPLAGRRIGVRSERQHRRGVLRRQREDPVELCERALGHDRRGHDARRDGLARHLGRRVEERREGAEARLVAVEPLRRVGPLHGRDLRDHRRRRRACGSRPRTGRSGARGRRGTARRPLRARPRRAARARRAASGRSRRARRAPLGTRCPLPRDRSRSGPGAGRRSARRRRRCRPAAVAPGSPARSGRRAGGPGRSASRFPPGDLREPQRTRGAMDPRVALPGRRRYARSSGARGRRRGGACCSRARSC